MKHSIFVKFIAIFLAAVSLVGAMASVAAITAIERAGLYVNSLDELQERQMNTISADIAKSFARLYAVKEYSNMTYSMRVDRYTDPETRADSDHWTLELRPREFALLEKLLSNPMKIFTRQMLMDEIWGYDSESDPRTVDTHIKRLREKLAAAEDFEIQTVRGLGYRAVLR